MKHPIALLAAELCRLEQEAPSEQGDRRLLETADALRVLREVERLDKYAPEGEAK